MDLTKELLEVLLEKGSDLDVELGATEDIAEGFIEFERKVPIVFDRDTYYLFLTS